MGVGILCVDGKHIPVTLEKVDCFLDGPCRITLREVMGSNATIENNKFDSKMIAKYREKRFFSETPWMLYKALNIDPLPETVRKNKPLLKEDYFKDVIINDKATIILWADGSKTVVKCQGDDAYSPEAGVAIAIMKKVLGNKGNYNNVLRRLVKKGLSHVKK